MISGAVPPHKNKIEGLDGLRGLAALLILIFHGVNSPMHPMFSTQPMRWSGFASSVEWITQTFSGGTTLFFVLSGFLITRSLISGRSISHDKIRDFYFRRLARIYPLYLVLLVLLGLIGTSASFVGLSVVFLANVADLFHVRAEWLPIWSLSVETHFYLLWPILLLTLEERGLAVVCLIMVLVSPGLRAWGFENHANIHAHTWFQMDGLALGALVAIAIKHDLFTTRFIEIFSYVGAIVFFLTVLVFPSLMDRDTQLGAIFFYQIFGLLAVVLIFGAIHRGRGFGWLGRDWLRQTGFWSYGIYVFHPILFFALRTLEKHQLLAPIQSGELSYIIVRAIVVSIASFALAALSNKFLERPAFDMLLRRYKHSRIGRDA